MRLRWGKKAEVHTDELDQIQETVAVSPNPKKEDYGLTSQIRRSALSVPGNIAEGFGRRHTKDKLNFYYMSRGSLGETKSHLIYGFKVGYFQESELSELLELTANIWEELNKLINSFYAEID